MLSENQDSQIMVDFGL